MIITGKITSLKAETIDCWTKEISVTSPVGLTCRIVDSPWPGSLEVVNATISPVQCQGMPPYTNSYYICAECSTPPVTMQIYLHCTGVENEFMLRMIAKEALCLIDTSISIWLISVESVADAKQVGASIVYKENDSIEIDTSMRYKKSVIMLK